MVKFVPGVHPTVSIPSRGSGKGDPHSQTISEDHREKFQSPLGEVVKETSPMFHITIQEPVLGFQSPLGEVVKETCKKLFQLVQEQEGRFNPLSGKW